MEWVYQSIIQYFNKESKNIFKFYKKVLYYYSRDILKGDILTVEHVTVKIQPCEKGFYQYSVVIRKVQATTEEIQNYVSNYTELIYFKDFNGNLNKVADSASLLIGDIIRSLPYRHINSQFLVDWWISQIKKNAQENNDEELVEACDMFKKEFVTIDMERFKEVTNKQW